MSYRDLVTADLRLVMLRVLAEASDYTCNSSVLQLALSKFGHPESRDRVHAELAWLAEQGLVTVQQIESVHVAQLTVRGLDVANGCATVPGVKRPGPK